MLKLTAEQQNRVDMMCVVYGYCAYVGHNVYAIRDSQAHYTSKNQVRLVFGDTTAIEYAEDGIVFNIYGDECISLVHNSGEFIVDIPLLVECVKGKEKILPTNVSYTKNALHMLTYYREAGVFTGIRDSGIHFHGWQVREYFAILDSSGNPLTPFIYSSVSLKRAGIPGVCSSVFNVRLLDIQNIANGFYTATIMDGADAKAITVPSGHPQVEFIGVLGDIECDKKAYSTVKLTPEVNGVRITERTFDSIAFPIMYRALGYMEVTYTQGGKTTAGIIDVTGKDIVPTGEWQVVQSAGLNGLFIVSDDQGYGIVKLGGDIIIPATYDGIHLLPDTSIIVCIKSDDSVDYLGNDAATHSNILDAFTMYRFKDADIYAIYIYNKWVITNSKLTRLKLGVSEESRKSKYWTKVSNI